MLPVVCSRTGDVLLEYHPDAALEDASTLFSSPLVFSMMIPVYQGSVVLIYNTWRDEWEIPAGHIEEGETPLQAALREMQEESCQVASNAKYAGLCLIRHPEQRLDPGVLDACELEMLNPFVACDEASAMLLWDTQSVVTQQVDEISVWLIQQFHLR